MFEMRGCLPCLLSPFAPLFTLLPLPRPANMKKSPLTSCQNRAELPHIACRGTWGPPSSSCYRPLRTRLRPERRLEARKLPKCVAISCQTFPSPLGLNLFASLLLFFFSTPPLCVDLTLLTMRNSGHFFLSAELAHTACRGTSRLPSFRPLSGPSYGQRNRLLEL